MKNTYFGTFATEAEKLNAMRYEIMEAGCGRCGDSDEMLRRFWETLESGLLLVVEDEDGMVEAEYANICVHCRLTNRSRAGAAKPRQMKGE